MKRDILERLEDGEQFIDAVDDAAKEIELLRNLLKASMPFVENMIGIASAARPLYGELENYFSFGTPCPHGYYDWDLCPDCRH